MLSLSVQNLITPAWGTIRQAKDEKVADEARRILLIIAENDFNLPKQRS